MDMRFLRSSCPPLLSYPLHNSAQHGVHADGWIHTAKLVFFVDLDFVRFVGESRPSSRRYPAPLRFGDVRGPLGASKPNLSNSFAAHLRSCRVRPQQCRRII